jgi:mannose-6-phosphate isomerase-like protein (cupin superfamily)
MNIEEYIDSGIILDYCLGLVHGAEKEAFEKAMLLYPPLSEELDAIQAGLNKYVSAYQKAPSISTKEKIMGTLENLLLEKEMALTKLPLINKFSNYQTWLDAVRPLIPDKISNELFMHILTNTDKVVQAVVKFDIDVIEEVHDDLFESFMILEGECECHIGTDRVIRLRAGDYLDIPLYESHNVKIISDYVVGIMQRIAA